MSLLTPRNNAINVNGNTVNGKTADIALTSHGSSFYFAICALMAVAGFAFIGLSFRIERRNRVFHYLTSAVVFVAAIAYFTMGSNLGFTPVQVDFVRSSPRVAGMYRSFFYVRYIDWVITTPLLLLDLLLTAGRPWPTVVWVVIVDEIMIITGLVGALISNRYKWAYFIFGCVALCYIVYQLVWESRIQARAYGRDVERAFLMCGSLTAFLWILYPIAWGVSEGGNVIAPDSEAVFYGILDFLAKPVFGALLLWGHRDIDPARLGLAFQDYDGDAVVHEKRQTGVTPATANPAHNGHSNGHETTTATATV